VWSLWSGIREMLGAYWNPPSFCQKKIRYDGGFGKAMSFMENKVCYSIELKISVDDLVQNFVRS
jgi:hypothetical protein